MPVIDLRKAGRRLRVAVTEAYGKPGQVRNQTQLSAAARVSRSVLDGWWGGVQPKAEPLQRVADALGVPAEQLWLRWLGYEPPEPGLTRIANEIKELREAITAAGGADPQLRDALAAIGAAREDQTSEEEANQPSAPVSSSRRDRPGA